MYVVYKETLYRWMNPVKSILFEHFETENTDFDLQLFWFLFSRFLG